MSSAIPAAEIASAAADLAAYLPDTAVVQTATEHRSASGVSYTYTAGPTIACEVWGGEVKVQLLGANGQLKLVDTTTIVGDSTDANCRAVRAGDRLTINGVTLYQVIAVNAQGAYELDRRFTCVRVS